MIEGREFIKIVTWIFGYKIIYDTIEKISHYNITKRIIAIN